MSLLLKLISRLHKIKGLSLQQNASPDIIYDINIAVRDIILYFKHLMCDAQQKKAKLYGFDQLDDGTCFWLKDFSQKILPMKFREGLREYFGKKGCVYMSIYFFLKRIITYLKDYTFHQSINVTKIRLIHCHLGRQR